jgi:hypothetical protein
MRHYQQAIQHDEARGDVYAAGQTRYNIAALLAGDGQISDALLYARAALSNFQQTGPGAAEEVARAQQLITSLETGTGVPAAPSLRTAETDVDYVRPDLPLKLPPDLSRVLISEPLRERETPPPQFR